VRKRKKKGNTASKKSKTQNCLAKHLKDGNQIGRLAVSDVPRLELRLKTGVPQV
jgi:hypothetical protein